MRGHPDLVLFMTDQQRFDQVGYASEGHFETPNIDQLAARGVIFEQAYSASTTCVPARVALLTGLQPHRVPTQVNRFALREGFWTVARALRDAGYETALIGKMHFAPVHAQHGFDTMRLCEHLRMQEQVPQRNDGDVFDDYHDWLLATGLDDWRFEGSSRPRGGSFPYAIGVHPTGWVEREALQFLERRDSRRPLFLIVSFPHPHAPYNPPEPYASMYKPADSKLPKSGFEINDRLPQAFRNAMTQFGKRRVPRVDPDTEQPLRKFLATIRGLVRHIDDAVGCILKQLDLTHTVVFFTSDHGDYAGHRGLLYKTPWLPFDDLARVPLIVAGGDVSGPRRQRQLVQNLDFALTCLDYAGVPAPSDYDFNGRSLRPLLSGTTAAEDDDRAVFCATTMGWPMVRRQRYKYIFNKRSSAKVLFDLESDPAEHINHWQDPDYALIADELSAALREELERDVMQIAPIL